MFNLDEVIKSYKSKAEFCRAMDVAPQFLTQIEKGHRPIPPKMARKLYEKHGVSLHSIRPDIYPA